MKLVSSIVDLGLPTEALLPVIASTDVAVAALYDVKKDIAVKERTQPSNPNPSLFPSIFPTIKPTVSKGPKRHLASYSPLYQSLQINKELSNQLFNLMNMIEILTEDVVPGQPVLDLIRPNIILSVTSAVFASGETTNSSVVLPTADSTLTGQDVSSQSFRLEIPIPLDVSKKAIKQDVWRVGGASMPYHLFLDPELRFAVQSDPLIIVAKEIKSSCGGDIGPDCLIVATLRRRTEALPKYKPESFSTTCEKGDPRLVLFSCENGRNVTTYCDGLSNYYLTEHCPVIREVPSCTRIMPTLSDSIINYCSATILDQETLICICPIDKFSFFGSSRKAKSKSVSDYSSTNDLDSKSLILSYTVSFTTTQAPSERTEISDKLKWYETLYLGVLAYRYFLMTAASLIVLAVSGYFYYRRHIRSKHLFQVTNLRKLGISWENRMSSTSNSNTKEDDSSNGSVHSMRIRRKTGKNLTRKVA